MAKSKTIFYKTDEEVAAMRPSCDLVSQTLGYVASILREGLTGAELDKAAEIFIRDHHATPVFKGLYGFPATLCISMNEAVVHGIPSKIPFKVGDIISVDCGTFLNGWVGDCAYTFVIGQTSTAVAQLLRVTNEALYKGIEQAKVGNRIGDISAAVQTHCEKNRYGVVRELCGHGVGKVIHEAPEVPNFGKRGNGIVLRNGLVIAVEPMVNMGTRNVRQLGDKWTIITADRKPSAHFEHSLVVRPNAPEILTTHSYIEAAIKKNSELYEISQKIPTFAA
jgi:methionyl aminopeptidase